METYSEQSLATESFSYSWLVNPKPISYESLSEPLNDSHADFSQEKPGFLSENHDPKATHNFNFDFSISNDPSTSPPVHADKLFSNGLIVPAAFATAPPLTSASTSKETSFSNTPTASNQIFIPSSSPVTPLVSLSKTHQQSIFPRKFSRFSWKILQRCLGCFVGIRGTRVDDFNRRAQEVKSFSNTPESVSPRMSTASAYSSWSDYNENSIYEAILYCKRSSGQ